MPAALLMIMAVGMMFLAFTAGKPQPDKELPKSNCEATDKISNSTSTSHVLRCNYPEETCYVVVRDSGGVAISCVRRKP